jgi:hypothetical protein
MENVPASRGYAGGFGNSLMAKVFKNSLPYFTTCCLGFGTCQQRRNTAELANSTGFSRSPNLPPPFK